MRLLAVDCATHFAGAAFFEDGVVRAASTKENAGAPSEQLLSIIDRVLREANVRVQSLDALALTVGPGSFSGLRVGVATAKGLVFGTACPVAPVSTTAALARAAAFAGTGVVAALDAQRGELYAEAFDPSGGPSPVAFDAGIYTPGALAAQIPPGFALACDDPGAAEAELDAQLDGGVERLRPVPRSRLVAVGELGAALLEAGEGVSGEALAPSYWRRAEAEARRLGAPAEGSIRRFDTP